MLSGVVVALTPIRHTPAGIPLLSLTIQHASEVMEANMKRKTECEVNAVVMGDLTKSPLSIGNHVQVSGFLAKQSAKSTQLILHIQNLKILKEF
ncbi:MAG TPA: primosomal replication protein N [Methylophilus sp.]|nr:primosomal replication protein N [Methylophilus sp.]HQQ33574.1 primosomal replication protein N [Methylophilus sp.]